MWCTPALGSRAASSQPRACSAAAAALLIPSCIPPRSFYVTLTAVRASAMQVHSRCHSAIVKKRCCAVHNTVAENSMNISSQELPFQYVGDMDEAAYLDALCQATQLRVCRVPSNGSCFFDSVYALLPTVGKAVNSARTLRLQIVQFFRECAEGQHGLLGERIMDDVAAAQELRIISSCAQTRCNNKKPKSVEAYFEAVSLQSVWVDGTPLFGSYLLLGSPLPRIPLA